MARALPDAAVRDDVVLFFQSEILGVNLAQVVQILLNGATAGGRALVDVQVLADAVEWRGAFDPAGNLSADAVGRA